MWMIYIWRRVIKIIVFIGIILVSDAELSSLNNIKLTLLNAVLLTEIKSSIILDENKPIEN